jgi:5-methylcytosine-specific restriction endonuclease McrA
MARRTQYNELDIVKEHSLDEIHSHPFNVHRRLKVFHHKGFKCVSCEIEGTKLITWIQKNKKGLHVSSHTDVYTEDMQLMTVDHIMPISKGGHKHDLNNLQPMCQYCNSKKCNKVPEIFSNEII